MALTEWVLLLPEIVALATYPDRVPAPPRSPALRSFSADPLTVLPPLPATYYPDAIRRLRPPSGTSAVLPPQPENTIALDWQGSYPSAVSRPRAPTPVAVYLPPDPEQTEAGWRGWYPDALPRPRRAQPLVEVMPPQPIVPYGWAPSYPDAVRRAAATPPSWSALPPQPLVPFAFVSFPDRLPAPRRPQQDGSASPLTVALVPPLVAPSYPDRIARAWLGVALFPSATFIYQPPPVSSTLSPCPVIPAEMESMPYLAARAESMPMVFSDEEEMPEVEAGIEVMPAMDGSAKC